MTALAEELRARLRESAPDPARLGALCDAAGHAERVAALRALGRAEQRALFRAVEGFRPLQPADLVPRAVDDGVAVRHHGRNTLPLFTHFEKRFCRPPGEDREKPTRVWGYNHQRLAPLTGPGYFVAYAAPDAGDAPCAPEVWIDYRRIPDARPEGWPALRTNERGLARLVYGAMVDVVRGVSRHVSIGSAMREGRPIGSWFVLVRED